MAKPRSRVEEEALETERRAQDVQRQIRQLSDQIANPKKHLADKAAAKKKDERTQSTIEQFRRFFSIDQATARGGAERRKATRMEMRVQRNRALFWAVVALIFLVWVFGNLLKRF